jgi:hypothetical protein
MFLLLILILYLSNFDPGDKSSAWAALVFLVIDIYVKITAVFMGFGVCSIDEVPGAITQMMCSIFGGADSIRDFIAFPKNNSGRDMMIDSPSTIDAKQMDELKIKTTV